MACALLISGRVSQTIAAIPIFGPAEGPYHNEGGLCKGGGVAFDSGVFGASRYESGMAGAHLADLNGPKWTSSGQNRPGMDHFGP